MKLKGLLVGIMVLLALGFMFSTAGAAAAENMDFYLNWSTPYADHIRPPFPQDLFSHKGMVDAVGSGNRYAAGRLPAAVTGFGNGAGECSLLGRWVN